jgi:hypothetical protein
MKPMKRKEPIAPKVHLVAGLTVIAGHYVRAAEIAEVFIFLTDTFHHVRKLLGGLV